MIMGWIRKNLVSLLILMVLASFSVRIWVGEHGLQARSALKARISGLEKKKQLLLVKRRELEHRVKLMAPGAVDPDMLEFQARKLLDFAYDRERIYVNGKSR